MTQYSEIFQTAPPGLLTRAARLVTDPRAAWKAFQQRAARLVHPPTVLHVTHYKAGSQWIMEILKWLDPARLMTPEIGSTHFTNRPVLPGKVYPTLYLTREQFEAVRLPRRWRRFVVVRDLRDTLISAYFSMKHSHIEMDPQMTEFRARLRSLSVEDGLSAMCAEWLPAAADMQRSWAAAGEPLVRYTDLLTDDVGTLTRVLIDHCRMRVHPEFLREVVMGTRFEVLTRGRQRGVEDVNSHERKGISGDWRNYFTDRLAKEFKSLYGDVLVAVGDEPNDRW